MTIPFTFAGVLAILICTLAIAKEGRNSASFAFGNFTASTGWVDGWSFCIGLLHAAYATSATGMILSMCEETRHPAVQVPRAMCGALFMNWVCGVFFLVPLMFVMPAIADVIADPYFQPLPFILRSAIGNEGGAFALCVPILILAILCGVACTTAASRCVWAFSRDGAIPGSRWWRQVNRKLDMPLNAMLLGSTVEALLGLIYFGSTAAFNAFSGSGVIFLTIAYVMPIAVSLFTGRKHLAGAPWNFGVIGLVCNVIAVGKCCTINLSTNATNHHISLVTAGHASLQLPVLQPCHRRKHELRFGRVCWLHCDLARLVLRLGTQALHWSTYRSGDFRRTSCLHCGTMSHPCHVVCETFQYKRPGQLLYIFAGT